MRVASRATIPAAFALALLIAVPAAAQQRDTIDVLYVGNSYTYFNNLPGLVEGISRGLTAGPYVRGTAHTHGGATLRHHIEDGHLGPFFSAGSAEHRDWDWVLLQEQSTLGQYDAETGRMGTPEAFHGAVRELVATIRTVGARPALYMTWAKQKFPVQAEELADAYRSIGTELRVPVAGVGEAWAEVLRARPDFVLHISDGSHPNPAGSYLAACVIYTTLTGQSPIGAPREIQGGPWDFAGPVASSRPTILVSLSAADAGFLQRIAWKVAGGKGSPRMSFRHARLDDT